MIGLEVDGAVATILLDRAPVNALDQDHVEQFSAALDAIEARNDVRVVLIRSSGTRFCAGADISLLEEWTDSETGAADQEAFSSAMQRAFGQLAALPVPTIAAIRGAATGGGLEMALACDIRVVGQTARLGLTEIRLGLVPGAGGTQRITQLLGRSRAMRLLVRGELVSGDQAELLGLADFSVPDDAVDGQALDLAHEIAQWPRPALLAMKECVLAADSKDGFRLESQHTRRLNRQPETGELVKAFFSSRR